MTLGDRKTTVAGSVLRRDEPGDGRSEGSAEGILGRAHEEVHGEEAYAEQARSA